VFAIFIFAYLLNMGKVQKNSLKKFLEEGQPILVLVFWFFGEYYLSG